MTIDTSKLGITEEGELMPFRINTSDEQENINKHFHTFLKNYVTNRYPHAPNYIFRIEGPLIYLTKKLAKEDSRWTEKKERGKNVHVFHSLNLLINYDEIINTSDYPFTREGIVPSYKRSVLELVLPIYAIENFPNAFVEICPYKEIKQHNLNGGLETIKNWAKNPKEWTKNNLRDEHFIELQGQPHYDKLFRKYL